MKKFSTNNFLLIFLLLYSCQKQNSLESIELPVSGNSTETFSGKSISEHAATVFIFLSPDCPVSESYTATIKQLVAAYQTASVQFINVFPGTFYSADTILSFQKRFSLDGLCCTDADKILTSLLHASITPECFLLDRNAEVVYSGAIDNWAVDLGTKRQNITEHYLKDAIDALLKGETHEINKTQAVGCFIE